MLIDKTRYRNESMKHLEMINDKTELYDVEPGESLKCYTCEDDVGVYSLTTTGPTTTAK